MVIDGDWYAVGVPAHNSRGAVYLYHYGDGEWSLHTTIDAPSPAVASFFGRSLAMSSRRLYVGAPRELVAEAGARLGNVYEYTIDGNAVELRRTLTRPADVYRDFGDAIALSSGQVFVRYVGVFNVSQLAVYGESDDCNGNGIPDECEVTLDSVEAFVALLLETQPNAVEGCLYDTNHDGSLNGLDIPGFLETVSRP